MNRWLSIPAGLCIAAFTVLYAALVAAVGGESRDKMPGTPDVLAVSFSPSTKSAVVRSAAIADVERTLALLRDEYLRPWQTIAKAPRVSYSRAAPRPVPPISAEINLVKLLDEADGAIVGTISVHQGTATQTIPCVVDRQTCKARFFHDGKWLAQDDWLKTAPIP